MPLQITRCSTLHEFQIFTRSATARAAEMAAYEQRLLPAAPDRSTRFAIPGHCLVCDRDAAFQVGFEHAFAAPDGRLTPNWREHLVCPHCRLNNRMRAAIGFILQASKPGGRIYLTEAVTPLFQTVAAKRQNLIGSEFLRDGTPPGQRNAAGIRHEDLTGLTFPAARFDLIATFEVLEHVPHYAQALAELSRCLADGGSLLMTVPFMLDNAATLTRATVDPSGAIRHILPPEIHGDPLDPEGALCFYHFGWDLMDALARAGFQDAGISLFWDPAYGYLGGWQFVITARKPPRASGWSRLRQALRGRP